MAKQNNDLLMENHKSSLTSSTLFLEMNAITHDHYTNRQTHGHDCGDKSKNTSSHQKWKNSEEKHEKEKSGQNNKYVENLYYCYGGKGHWSHTYCTPKHLIDLYQESPKNKEKKI